MRLSTAVVKSWEQFTIWQRKIIAQLNAQIEWRKPGEVDPEDAQDGQIWVRVDLPELRLKIGGKLYSINIREV